MDQFSALASMCERADDDETASACPLCQYGVVSLDDLKSHLGEHQEELALSGLPRSVYPGPARPGVNFRTPPPPLPFDSPLLGRAEKSSPGGKEPISDASSPDLALQSNYQHRLPGSATKGPSYIESSPNAKGILKTARQDHSAELSRAHESRARPNVNEGKGQAQAEMGSELAQEGIMGSEMLKSLGIRKRESELRQNKADNKHTAGSPTFSISELIQDVILARNVYQVFCVELGFAAARIGEIASTLAFLVYVLQQVEAIAAHYRITFPSGDTLKLKLHESEKYLADYWKPTRQSLVDPKSGDVRTRVRRFGRTPRLAAFERDVDRINAGLSLETQKLTWWMFVLGW